MGWEGREGGEGREAMDAIVGATRTSKTRVPGHPTLLPPFL